jgi:cell division protein FtsQ
MTDFTRFSQTDLRARRQTLRRQRRVRLLQSLWRNLAICGLAMVTVMVATSPQWQVRDPGQIEISGNQLLPDDAIYDLLPIAYPQSLLKIQPQMIERTLTTQGPIAEAIVSRRLLPPGLNVRIRERHPVAITIPNTAIPISSVEEIAPFSQMGLLDESGYWMPYNSFSQLNQEFTPPVLQVYGMRASYQADWPGVYQALQQSPVKIVAVDWRKPSNFILQTELGTVHLGPYGQAFSEQLAALDRMRNLNAEVNTEKVAFIDLRNPQKPTVQILQATNTP